MSGKNWHSATHVWKDLVRPSTKAKAARAKMMRGAGMPVSKIATQLDLSRSRIYELLRP
ncbi:helix-turn-helix domain-containing protein [Myxococcus sp. MISCRS1]|uniref:helix-turn-helix domain-containing protein n=1 Tax=Myxococcus sp. MISCRS1 TaxID=2996786 RepID=UPI003B63BAA2